MRVLAYEMAEDGDKLLGRGALEVILLQTFNPTIKSFDSGQCWPVK